MWDDNFYRPFLTELDSRAKIKGSRDPLGFQIVWTILGRRIIKNLTTVTTSPRNFTVLLLGYYFAQKLISERGNQVGDFANLFLKFEQLAAYSRYSQNSSTDFSEEEMRGILRVKKNLAESRKVLISSDQEAQILSNQKTYGIWGLYTVASKSSGLIDENHYQLKPEAIEFVEKNYLKLLPDAGEPILTILSKDKYIFEPDKKDKKLAESLSNILTNKLTSKETDFYTKYLIYSGNTKSDQYLIWEEIKGLNQDGSFDWKFGFSKNELTEIIKRIKKNNNEILSEKLQNILVVENVIAPLSRIFNYIMGNDQQKLQSIGSDIEKVWSDGIKSIDIDDFTKVAKSLSLNLSNESINNLIQLAESLTESDYEKTIKLLIERNSIIMKDRGGSAWLKVDNGKLDIRFREESDDLPRGEELKDLWVHPYFINSLKIIGYKIQRYQL